MRRAWGLGNGFMLFDLGGYQRERFVMTSIFDLVALGPKNIVGLEFQPEDGRAVRYLQPPDGGSLTRYIVAGTGYTDTAKATFQMETFQNIPVDLMDWRPGASLAVPAGSIDVVLIQSSAAESLGPKGLQQAIKEAARLLKPFGQFILFREADNRRPLPEVIATYFSVNATVEESCLILSKLVPLPKRRKPGATSSGLRKVQRSSTEARTRTRPKGMP